MHSTFSHACILFARQGSKGVPGKNRYRYLGVPSYEIILTAANAASANVFVCTDDTDINAYATANNILSIPRPAQLAGDETHLEKVISYAYQNKLHQFDVITILLGNAPYVTTKLIVDSVSKLEQNPHLDSIVSVSPFPMFAPERARKIESDILQPYHEQNSNVTCDRSSHSNCYFPNGAFTTVRSEKLKDLSLNQPPLRWMGQTIGYIVQNGGLGDVDEAWQIPVVENWFRLQDSAKNMSSHEL